VGIRARVLRLEREAEEELVSVHLRDGRSARFREEEIFPECFLHEYDRVSEPSTARTRERLTRLWRL
jgi:hypothetical protein